MGTRADFYVGRGADAEWLGSVAWDGHPAGFKKRLFGAKTETEWREMVAKELAGRDDATVPADGWPWPWNNSQTTDYAYAFDGGQTFGSCFGHAWFDPLNEPDDDDDEGGDSAKVPFPDMSARQAVTLGKRSGVMVFGVKGEP